MAKQEKDKKQDEVKETPSPVETVKETEDLKLDAAEPTSDVDTNSDPKKKESTGGGAPASASTVKSSTATDPGQVAPLPPTGPTLFETATGSQKYGGSATAVANRAGAQSASSSVISFKQAINKGRIYEAFHVSEEAPSNVLPESYKLGKLVDYEETHYRANESISDLDNNIYHSVNDIGAVLEISTVMYIDGMIDTTARAEVGASDVQIGYQEDSVPLGLIAALPLGVGYVKADDYGKALNEPDGGYHGRNEDTHILFEVNNAGNTISTFSRFTDQSVLQSMHHTYYKTGAFADTNAQDKIDLE